MHRKKRTATNSSENKQCLFLFFASLMWLKYIFLKFIEVHSSRFLQTDRSVPHTTPLLNILTLFPLTVCVFTFPGKLKGCQIYISTSNLSVLETVSRWMMKKVAADERFADVISLLLLHFERCNRIRNLILQPLSVLREISNWIEPTIFLL